MCGFGATLISPLMHQGLPRNKKEIVIKVVIINTHSSYILPRTIHINILTRAKFLLIYFDISIIQILYGMNQSRFLHICLTLFFEKICIDVVNQHPLRHIWSPLYLHNAVCS